MRKQVKMNLRSVELSPEEQVTFTPETFSQRLLDAGFKFDHIGCPYKITKPWKRVKFEDGSVVYWQWDE